MHFNWDGPSRHSVHSSSEIHRLRVWKTTSIFFIYFELSWAPQIKCLVFFSKPFGHQPFTAAASIATIRALGEHSPLLRPIVGFFVIQTYIIQTQRSEWYNTRGATSNINLHVHIMTAAFLFQPSLCNRYIRIFTIKAEKLHEHCERNQDVSQNLTD